MTALPTGTVTFLSSTSDNRYVAIMTLQGLVDEPG